MFCITVFCFSLQYSDRPQLEFLASACLPVVGGSLLTICPSHSHFLPLNVIVTDFCFVRLQSSVSEIFYGLLIIRILRRQLLTKTCRFFSIVVLCFHVSESYSRTDFTVDVVFETYYCASPDLRYRTLVSQYWYNCTEANWSKYSYYVMYSCA